MKKIFLCLIVFAQISMVQSCKKNPLDITPDGRITMSEVFKDRKLSEAYVNSIYNYIRLYGCRYYPNVMLAVFSDDAHGGDDPQDSWSQVSLWYHGQLTPTSNPLDAGDYREAGIKWNGQYWQDGWAAIRKANVFLSSINEVNIDDPNEKKRLYAEVRTLRAFFYLELIKMYGGMPIIASPLPSGFDYSTLKRNTFAECVDFITKDCDAALSEPNLPYRIVIEGERGRFTKAVAYAVKSEALLYNASPLWNPTNDVSKWKAAADASKGALDTLLRNDYILYPDYETYFQGNSSNSADHETIFEIKNPSAVWDDGSLWFLNGIPSVGAALAGAGPSQELVDSYDMSNGKEPILGYTDDDHLHPIINVASGYDDDHPYDNRDPRFYASVWYNQAYYGIINGTPHYVDSYLGGVDGIANLRNRTHNGYYLRKYNDPALRLGNTGSVRWKKYRLAEIYLNYAEAANEAYGPIDDVYDAIDAIRKRVNMPDLERGLSKDDMRKRIRKERRVEMAFEEQRFWDVRRWKILDKVGKLTTGMAWTKVSNGVFTRSRIVVDHRDAWSDKFLIFPIQSDERSRLPAFNQNPGWED